MLYIFETNVAFVVFEIDYNRDINLDSIIDYNYVLKKMLYNRGTLSFVKNRLIGEIITIEITKLVMNLILDLKVKTFFVGKEGLPGQAIVYNAVYIDKKPEDNEIETYLYWLRRSFKESYLPSDVECKVLNNDEIFRPFQNSYWGVSLEGVANFIHATDKVKTNDFFNGNYFGNIKNTYFYAFMLALHQRYALIYLSILASELKLTANNDIETIEKLKEKIIMFNLRCSFNHITNITHYSKLYEMLRKNMHVEELMSELHFELSILSTMVEMEYSRENEQLKDIESRKQNNFNTVIVLATTAFVMVSTAADAWSVINVLSDELKKSHLSNQLIIYLAVIFLIFGLGFMGLIVFLKNNFENKSKN